MISPDLKVYLSLSPEYDPLTGDTYNPSYLEVVSSKIFSSSIYQKKNTL